LRRTFFGRVSVLAGPHFYHYWNHPSDNVGKILEVPANVGLDSIDVYANKSYLGGKVAIDLNNLNSELFPTRGISWYTEYSFLSGVTKQSNPVSKIQSDMVVYASLRSPARFVTVVRLGAGKIFNDNFEYFQAMNLGSNNFLRGFRKNRFSGSALAYGSLEFRIKLFESRWYILPGDVGIIAFNDIGRVWMKGDPSRRWHNATGGGIYYVPFNMVIVSANLAFSKEATLFNFSVGTKINLTF
jgi:outer membrane protein assembly factor BamA